MFTTLDLLLLFTRSEFYSTLRMFSNPILEMIESFTFCSSTSVSRENLPSQNLWLSSWDQTCTTVTIYSLICYRWIEYISSLLENKLPGSSVLPIHTSTLTQCLNSLSNVCVYIYLYTYILYAHLYLLYIYSLFQYYSLIIRWKNMLYRLKHFTFLIKMKRKIKGNSKQIYVLIGAFQKF